MSASDAVVKEHTTLESLEPKKVKKKPTHPWRVYVPSNAAQGKAIYTDQGKFYKGLSKMNRAR